MRWAMWLYPGLKVKRWLFLAFLGFVMVGTSIAVLNDGEVFSYLEIKMRTFASELPDRKTLASFGSFFLTIGLLLMGYAFTRMVRSLIEVLYPRGDGSLVELLYTRRHLGRGPKVVVIGGGTGLAVLLRGLKEYTSNLTAIVTVADDGGSSGRLRQELGILPPGDVRNCLVALADTETLMEELFDYRFGKGRGLAGHSLGNLLLAAATHTSGGFDKAIEVLSQVLAIRGRVLPSTLDQVTLCAEMSDGSTVKGESAITESALAVQGVMLEPEEVLAMPAAIEAIEEADAVILGPGSLYTSVLPNLLVKGIAEAVARTSATRIYISNVMTQKGETDGYSASMHVEAIRRLGIAIDTVLVNVDDIPRIPLRKYKEKGQHPVRVDLKALESLGVKIAKARLINETNLVRHDPQRLAQAIMKLVFYSKPQSEQMGLVDIFLMFKKLRRK